jgi:hypothetical protein
MYTPHYLEHFAAGLQQGYMCAIKPTALAQVALLLLLLLHLEQLLLLEHLSMHSTIHAYIPCAHV